MHNETNIELVLAEIMCTKCNNTYYQCKCSAYKTVTDNQSDPSLKRRPNCPNQLDRSDRLDLPFCTFGTVGHLPKPSAAIDFNAPKFLLLTPAEEIKSVRYCNVISEPFCDQNPKNGE